MMNKAKYKRWPFIVGTLCLLAAAVITLSNHHEDRVAGEQAKEILDSIHEVTPITETAFSSAQSLLEKNSDEQIVPDYILNPDMEMPSIEIDGNLYIGTISFPTLDLELPVMNSWSYPKLKKAPCLYFGSIYKGNAVIAAHNYDSHFGRLPELKVGDTICFTDTDGNVFNYEVIIQEVLAPSAIDEMVGSDADLTLFACTVGGASRFTVRCKVIESQGYL